MLNSSPEQLTEWHRFFLEPKNATHRQYEALRAYFVEGVTSKEAAKKLGAVTVISHDFWSVLLLKSISWK